MSAAIIEENDICPQDKRNQRRAGSTRAAPQVENVIIIGSGPSGFTAGLYTARANLNPLLITGNDYGGQVSITYEVENYPGFPESLSGPELVEKMKEQAEKFGTRVEFDYVNEIVTDQHPFVVRTANGKEYSTTVHHRLHGRAAALSGGAGREGIYGQGRQLLRHL